MPDAPEHYCNHPTCSTLVRQRSKCPEHTKQTRASADAERREGRARHYKTARWKRIRRRQLAREHLCRACRAMGKWVPAKDVDHIVPLEQGGTDAPSNLQSLCHPHHSRKTSTQDGGFGRPAEGVPGDPSGDFPAMKYFHKAGGGVGGGET